MRRALLIGLILATCLGFTLAVLARSTAPLTIAVDVPASLTDQEFWSFVQQTSEPGGYFRNANITNLTSNELRMQEVIPDLVARTKPGGVYLGVGPEQNFTYMAATRPRLAIIFDVRRGNLDLQLMYKALFELAGDRADFLSMLFAKPRPAGLGADATANDLVGALAGVAMSAPLEESTLRAIEDRLTRTHHLPLPADDLAGIGEVYRAFAESGFAIRPSPTFADLMTSTDGAGLDRNFLAASESFTFLKDLESRNLVVPVVGDFGGPKAIRAVGAYLTARHAVVTAFYLSNVEQYLEQDGTWSAFCRNVATLPLDASSTFIRSSMGGGGGGFGRFGGGFVSSLGEMAQEVRSCH